jgi:hypothetical protein
MSERGRKCRRRTRSDLTRILETLETGPQMKKELRKIKGTLEMLTAAHAAEVAQQGKEGQH